MPALRGSDRAARLQSSAAVVSLAVISTFLWGTAFPSVKIGYQLFSIPSGATASQLLFAGSRFLCAGVLTLLLALAVNRRLPVPGKGRLPGIALLGLVQTTLQYFFMYIGMSNTTGAKGSIIDASAAFIGVILAHFLCRGDRMTRRKALGCLVGFSGIVVLNLGGPGGGLDGGFSLAGEGAVFCAAFASAFGLIISSRVARGEDPMTVTGWQLLIGGAVLFGLGLVGGGRMTPLSGTAWVLLAYMAALSAVSFTLWTILLKYNRVARIGIYNSLIPVFGTLCSGVFLHEKVFGVRSLAALTLVCAGIYTVNREPKKALVRAD